MTEYFGTLCKGSYNDDIVYCILTGLYENLQWI